ncbi:MFS transporter [Aeromonas rivipollensis]|uniref:MFS transporter n=1 Tax=Aeromonas rivipollensis TaxID=948519 RepID=UPI00259EB87C|nr:MFS transporter [Aeromonas rivipollensis]MDM5084048.1 MFS transporter [Aeromonas rivipollensis]MDM5097748.1 MFS transporter [Aeromonas rivipollensis]MDM5104766.1 MFS transporter [Aeromonas rivipollensis]
MIEVGSREWIRATLALSLGSFLVFLNLYQTHPLLPLLAQVFSVSSLSAGWTLAGCTAGLAGSLLICARLADRFGRRRIMLWTLTCAILLSLCIPGVTRFDLLVCLRILQGALLAGLPATAIAYMGEEFSKRALLSAVGVYIAANSLGGIAGRVVGGLLAGWFGDWQHTFLGIGLISLALLPLVIWLLPAQTRFVAVEAAPGQLRRAIQSHLGNPLLLGAYLIGGLNFMVFLNQYSYLTFLLAKAPFSLPTQWLGMLFLTYLTGTLASSLSGRCAHRWGAQRLLLAGIALMALGSLALLQGTLAAIIGGLLVSSFGFFLAHACASAWVGQHVEHNRALASSLYLVGYYLGASLGGLYLHPFWERGGLWGLVLGIELVLCVTAALSLWLGHLKGRTVPPLSSHASSRQ